MITKISANNNRDHQGKVLSKLNSERGLSSLKFDAVAFSELSRTLKGATLSEVSQRSSILFSGRTTAEISATCVGEVMDGTGAGCSSMVSPHPVKALSEVASERKPSSLAFDAVSFSALPETLSGAALGEADRRSSVFLSGRSGAETSVTSTAVP